MGRAIARIAASLQHQLIQGFAPREGHIGDAGPRGGVVGFDIAHHHITRGTFIQCPSGKVEFTAVHDFCHRDSRFSSRCFDCGCFYCGCFYCGGFHCRLRLFHRRRSWGGAGTEYEHQHKDWIEQTESFERFLTLMISLV